MPKILILNGSHSDIPLIKAAKKIGYHVITSGNRPDLIGHRYADEYIPGDFSDMEKMCLVAENNKVDAICSCSNDFGAISASYVAEKLGLPGHDPYETTLVLHHKDRFKQFARKHDIPTPLAESYTECSKALEMIEAIKYPVMVKPIDLTGGKGVTKVESRGEYEEAVKKAFNMSPAGHIVVEPFIKGTHHSFSTFLVDKKVAAYYSDNEYSFASPFLVSTSAGPANSVEKVSDELIAVSEKIARILDLRNGVFHIQYILSEDERPYILEITRRCSGDLYSLPVEHSTGIPWAEWIVRTECGMSCDDFPKGAKQKIMGGRHCIIGNRNGELKGIYISPEIEGNIYGDLIWWENTRRIDNYLVDKVGIVLLEYNDREDMLHKTENIMDYIHPIYV